MNWFDRFLSELQRESFANSLDNFNFAATATGLVIALVLGHILAWHYIRYAAVLSNKRKFARMFVFVACTTLLMITVVKTSLALSLGLVGAMSIIRFRTPIKEPEELAYLFLAIAIGVGLGANQALPTTLVFCVLLVYLAFRSNTGKSIDVQTVLQVTIPIASDNSGGDEFRTLLPALESSCSRVELRRVDRYGQELHASLTVEIEGPDKVASLLDKVSATLPASSVSLIERDGCD